VFIIKMIWLLLRGLLGDRGQKALKTLALRQRLAVFPYSALAIALVQSRLLSFAGVVSCNEG
jgi:hypothetical protein